MTPHARTALSGYYAYYYRLYTQTVHNGTINTFVNRPVLISCTIISLVNNISEVVVKSANEGSSTKTHPVLAIT